VSWSPGTWQHLCALLARPVVADHGRAPVAAFDADGTLWSGDAFGALGAELVRRGLVDREACERVEVEYGRSQGEERRKWLLESLALFRGLSAEELVDAGEEAWGRGDGATGLGATLRPEMSDLVNQLRSGGWRVLVVTASPAEAVLRGAQVLGVRLEFDLGGRATGLPAPSMPLTWCEGKAAALDAYGVVGGRLCLAVGNSMDDVPMLRRAQAGMLCVPRGSVEEDRWTGEAEGAQRLARVAAEEGFWLHEATQGREEYLRLAAEAKASCES